MSVRAIITLLGRLTNYDCSNTTYKLGCGRVQRLLHPQGVVGHSKCLVRIKLIVQVRANQLGRAILHDPVAYPNPDCFIPERFLTVQDGKYMNNPDVQDPRIAVFGFGRRCVTFNPRL